MGQTAVIPAQIVGVAARSLLANNTNAEAACQTISFAASSAGHVLTVQGDGSVAFAAVSAGIGGSTGSTDNLVLRADGAGGATLQNSGWLIPDIYTSSPNATVNHLSLQATGSSTNVSVSIVPKGSGSFSLHVPDGTSTGGNARGANSVDLQTVRSAANQVASGYSSIVAGQNNLLSATRSICTGDSNTVSGDWNAAFCNNNTVSSYSNFVSGSYNTISGNNCFAAGFGHTVSANSSVALGHNCEVSGVRAIAVGEGAHARQWGEFAHAAGSFASRGDCQRIANVLRGSTTTNAAVELTSPARFVIPAGHVWHGRVTVTGVKNGGGVVARYVRQVSAKRVVNTTTLNGTVDTIGVDDAQGTSLSITADDTNESIKVEPTGVLNETWRWQAIFDGGLIAFG